MEKSRAGCGDGSVGALARRDHSGCWAGPEAGSGHWAVPWPVPGAVPEAVDEALPEALLGLDSGIRACLDRWAVCVTVSSLCQRLLLLLHLGILYVVLARPSTKRASIAWR